MIYFKAFLTILNNFLGLSCSISVYLGLFGTILVYLGLFWIMLYYLKLSRTILDYLGHSGSIWDYLGLYGTIWNYLGLSGTIQVHNAAIMFPPIHVLLEKCQKGVINIGGYEIPRIYCFCKNVQKSSLTDRQGTFYDKRLIPSLHPFQPLFISDLSFLHSVPRFAFILLMIK